MIFTSTTALLITAYLCVAAGAFIAWAKWGNWRDGHPLVIGLLWPMTGLCLVVGYACRLVDKFARSLRNEDEL